MTTDAKHVWVLGAGFSKPLGGPLLGDLFREEDQRDIEAYFPPIDYSDLAHDQGWVQSLFKEGAHGGFWVDAEQFLTYVDDAYRPTGEPKMRKLTNLVQRAMSSAEQGSAKQTRILARLDRMVRRALAVDCSRFLMGIPPDSELWIPYHAWIQSLVPGRDVVLTFNYDLVIETAIHRDDPEHEHFTNKIWVGLPGERQPREVVPVYKLHGSIDWAVLPGKHIVGSDRKDRLEALRSGETKIAIAAPGSSKAEFVREHLEPLWRPAEKALAEAERVFFIGYSFPDTDPSPQDRLLNAFASEPGEISFRRADIILGRDHATSDLGRRALELVRSTAAKRQVFLNHESSGVSALSIYQRPLGTQDFIGRWQQIVDAAPISR